ncbi:MAG: hypothetical protein MN733_03265 [Nitrososphaera sp.]|nr:hypothetical protein [Nitrososphaera sp.]
MTAPTTRPDLVERLRHLLISSGVNGISQRQITMHFANLMKANEIKSVLESWRVVGAVQRFRVESEASCKPTIVWRATTKLVEESGDEYTY